MMRLLRAPLRSVAVFVAVAALLAACTRETVPEKSADSPTGTPVGVNRQPAQGPNLIWIVLDACRGDRLSYTGYSRQTSPNLDQLAAEGAVFLNHFTQGAYTELSVPSYMTGRYFPVACMDVMRTYPLRDPPPGEHLFPAIMADNGYYSACYSAHAWILSDSRLAQSFHEFHRIQPGPKSPSYVASFEELNVHVFPWISKNRNRPFFLYLHALDTHFPHLLEPPHDKWMPERRETPHVSNGIPKANFGMNFSEQEQQLLSGMHDGSIHYSDKHIGRLLEHLKALNLLQDTVVVVSSDHGDALGEDGRNWGHWIGYDEVLHVPLLIAGPGVPQGVRIDALTENVDIVPTLVDVLDLEVEPFAPDGHSLLPVMQNPAAPPLRDYVLSKYFHHEYDGAQGFLLRGHQFKFEHDQGRKEEHLWLLPDEVGSRKDVFEDHPEAVSRFRTILNDEILPAWQSYMDLPKAAFALPVKAAMLTPEDALVFLEDSASASEALWSDNKWHLAEGVLWHAGWQEDVPPLEMEMEVPAGRYVVQFEVLSTRNHLGRPASAFTVHLPHAADPVEIAMTPVDHLAYGFEWKDIGTLDLAEGVFRCTISDGDPGFWGALRRIRFVSPSDDESGLNEAAVEVRAEQLRALGYLE